MPSDDIDNGGSGSSTNSGADDGGQSECLELVDTLEDEAYDVCQRVLDEDAISSITRGVAKLYFIQSIASLQTIQTILEYDDEEDGNTLPEHVANDIDWDAETGEGDDNDDDDEKGATPIKIADGGTSKGATFATYQCRVCAARRPVAITVEIVDGSVSIDRHNQRIRVEPCADCEVDRTHVLRRNNIDAADLSLPIERRSISS